LLKISGNEPGLKRQHPHQNSAHGKIEDLSSETVFVQEISNEKIPLAAPSCLQIGGLSAILWLFFQYRRS
jgi:hypothetical protein